MESVNPADGSTLATYSPIDSQAVEEKLVDASRAFRKWRTIGVHDRARWVSKLGEVLTQNQETLAHLTTQEMGKPIVEARAEIAKSIRLCTYYATHSHDMLKPRVVPTEAAESMVRYDPLGPVLGIMPWNYPVWQVIRFAVPTLMAGNTVLLKHAPNVCGTALAIERCFEQARFDSGVYSALVIEVDDVERLLSDQRVAGVSLTGSVRAGKAVAEIAGRHLKPCVLELGGSDPFIVLHDADLDAAAAAAVSSRFVNAGQSCIAAKRFLVEDAVHDAFVERIHDRIKALVLGDPLNDKTTVGPLARADLLTHLRTQVDRSVTMGARLATGGQPAKRGGNFYEPTLLLNVTPGMPAFDEETFGPVAAITRVQSADEAVELANATRYGLGAAVFSRGERGRRMVSELDAGFVALNAFVKSDPRLPFGGIKDSGYGRELSREGLLAFVNTKTVWLQR